HGARPYAIRAGPAPSAAGGRADRCPESRATSDRCSGATVRFAQRRRLAAHLGRGCAVHLRLPLLGCVRTGGLEPDALCRSLRAARAARAEALRLVVCVGAGAVRDSPVAAVRLGVDTSGAETTLES